MVILYASAKAGIMKLIKLTLSLVCLSNAAAIVLHFFSYKAKIQKSYKH